MVIPRITMFLHNKGSIFNIEGHAIYHN
jgi:hypothetical protein